MPPFKLLPHNLLPHPDPLVRETIALFGGSVLLEGSPETHCPLYGARQVAGLTPRTWSSANTAEGIDFEKTPITAFLFCTTIADIESLSPESAGYVPPVWKDNAAFESWLRVRRNPCGPDAHLYASLCMEAFADQVNDTVTAETAGQEAVRP
ncbi:MAG: hypothetical protein V4671_11740 [Armatimonadota bacterium]